MDINVLPKPDIPDSRIIVVSAIPDKSAVDDDMLTISEQLASAKTGFYRPPHSINAPIWRFSMAAGQQGSYSHASKPLHNVIGYNFFC